MEYQDIYTAAVIQNEFKCVRKRHEIKENLKRVLELIGMMEVYQGTGGVETPGFAPLRLVTLPEFFIQGYHIKMSREEFLKEVVIEIPGEETDALGELAKKMNIYIAGVALEIDLKWKDRYFNTGFIVDPTGEVILKYRKYTPAITMEYNLSPHDMLDEYAKYYGVSYRELFPVVDTPIGKLGMCICMDGFFPENARALGLQGAEVIIRNSGSIEPLGIDYFELINRARAFENLAYVVAPTAGPRYSDEIPKAWSPGGSMIVDYNGRVMTKANYPAESAVTATINLEELRRRRLSAPFNFLTLLRTEAYHEMYEAPIYPANQFMDEQPRLLDVKGKKQPINEWVERGIYKAPKNVRPSY